MNLTSQSFREGERIPAEFAFGKPHPESHVELSSNRNPQLSWSGVPEGTRSFVLVCHDPDVPSRPDAVNKEGMTVPRDLERVNFYHWVLVDIPTSRSEIRAGTMSDGVTAKGKSGPEAMEGMRQGVNTYTQWFESDPKMAGTYFGYDGPCPPWNDERLHHYVFTLYALSVPRCPVVGRFAAPDVLGAIEGKILARATLTGSYSLFQDAR